jgi:hypothetical protein
MVRELELVGDPLACPSDQPLCPAGGVEPWQGDDRKQQEQRVKATEQNEREQHLRSEPLGEQERVEEVRDLVAVVAEQRDPVVDVGSLMVFEAGRSGDKLQEMRLGLASGTSSSTSTPPRRSAPSPSAPPRSGRHSTASGRIHSEHSRLGRRGDSRAILHLHRVGGDPHPRRSAQPQQQVKPSLTAPDRGRSGFDRCHRGVEDGTTHCSESRPATGASTRNGPAPQSRPALTNPPGLPSSRRFA